MARSDFNPYYAPPGSRQPAGYNPSWLRSPYFSLAGEDPGTDTWQRNQMVQSQAAAARQQQQPQQQQAQSYFPPPLWPGGQSPGNIPPPSPMGGAWTGLPPGVTPPQGWQSALQNAPQMRTPGPQGMQGWGAAPPGMPAYMRLPAQPPQLTLGQQLPSYDPQLVNAIRAMWLRQNLG